MLRPGMNGRLASPSSAPCTNVFVDLSFRDRHGGDRRVPLRTSPSPESRDRLVPVCSPFVSSRIFPRNRRIVTLYTFISTMTESSTAPRSPQHVVFVRVRYYSVKFMADDASGSRGICTVSIRDERTSLTSKIQRFASLHVKT
jgi:hypothetical protein